MNKVIPFVIAMFLFAVAHASDYVVVRASDRKIELNGEEVESMSALEEVVDAIDSKYAVVQAHLCLDAKTVIQIMGIFSNRNYTQISLQTYGEVDDSEC
jgi:hypothetical protein